MKILIMLSSIIFSIFIIYLTLVFCINEFSPLRKMIYLPRETTVYPKIGNDIKIEIKNNNRMVYGLLSSNGKKLIVFFHGNGAIINDFEFIVKTFYKKGYSTLLVEYPGYGLSYNYKTSEGRIYSDCKKMINYVKAKYNFNTIDTYFFGWSLGSGVATEMMKDKLGSKMLIVSSFTSVPDVAHQKFIKVLTYFFITDRFSNKQKAKLIMEPVLLIHGTKDRFIPYEMSVKLNKLFPNSELISIKNADHANIFKFINKDIWNRIFKFYS
jgi:pimeloyl-ACP methyl ester carboxylesterase